MVLAGRCWRPSPGVAVAGASDSSVHRQGGDAGRAWTSAAMWRDDRSEKAGCEEEKVEKVTTANFAKSKIENRLEFGVANVRLGGKAPAIGAPLFVETRLFAVRSRTA